MITKTSYYEVRYSYTITERGDFAGSYNTKKVFSSFDEATTFESKIKHFISIYNMDSETDCPKEIIDFFGDLEGFFTDVSTYFVRKEETLLPLQHGVR